MPNNPAKFGIKFWMAVDAESKYQYNGFLFLGKNLTRSGDASLPTDVVIKLMSPLFRQGFNVTCSNYFTSFDLSLRLVKQQCSLLMTIRANRREISDLLKKKRMLHDTMVVNSTGGAKATIASYQCNQSKFVNILSTPNKDVVVSEHTNPKCKSETVPFYNQKKFGVDVLDQMSRLYSVKAASRRWPLNIFYTVIDMALINSWVIYKAVCKSNISRRTYVRKVC